MEPASTVSFSEQSTFDSPRPRRNNKKLIGIIIIILVIIGLIFMGIRNSQGNKSEEQITPTEAQEEPTEEPTQEPTPEEDVTPTKASPSPRPTSGAITSAKDLAIQVVNGSGTVGAAGEVQSYLKSKGYTNIETGNADNFDYQGVTVKIKSTRNKFLDALQNDLKGKYSLSASGSGSLAESSTFDAQVIVGK